MREHRDIKNLLHQYIIDHEIFGNYEYRGKVNKGHLFVVQDQIIKITTDIKEVEAADYFLHNPHKVVAEYYQTDWVNDFGYIKMELIKPLNPTTNKDLILKWRDLIDIDSTLKFSSEEENFRLGLLDFRDEFEMTSYDLHWTNFGFNSNNQLKAFDPRINS